MNFKTTIVLLVLLACVGIYFAVEHYSGAGKPAETVTNPAKLITARTDDITKVSVTQPDGKNLVLNRVGKDWRMTEPVDAKADTFAVEDLLRQLTGLQSRGELPADQKATVGLDHPKFTVEITAGGKVTKLAVGDENKIGDSLYVLAGDQQNPQIVATTLYDQLNKQPTDYRSKKLTDLSFDQTERVKQLTLKEDGKTIRLDKEGSDWEITEPRQMPADSAAVSSMVSSLADLNATDFVQSPSAATTYGLAKPALTVSYTTAPAAGTATTQPVSHEIAFGRFSTIEHNEVYASVDGGPVATVAATTEDNFKKTALDLRDKKVVDIDPAHVTSFTLSVDRPATAQPTTQPAATYEYTIARRKETTVIGPQFPALPTTQQTAATRPSTQPAVASTEPATQPVASTEPATQPVAETPKSKWIFESGASGNANDAEVEALLTALHPLNAIKFLEKAPTTEPAGSYLLTVHVGPANGKGPQDYVLRFTAPASGNLNGGYQDLAFETDRALLDKLDAKFAPTAGK